MPLRFLPFVDERIWRDEAEETYGGSTVIQMRDREEGELNKPPEFGSRIAGKGWES